MNLLEQDNEKLSQIVREKDAHILQ